MCSLSCLWQKLETRLKAANSEKTACSRIRQFLLEIPCEVCHSLLCFHCVSTFKRCLEFKQNYQKKKGPGDEDDGNQNSEAVLHLLESMKPKKEDDDPFLALDSFFTE